MSTMTATTRAAPAGTRSAGTQPRQHFNRPGSFSRSAPSGAAPRAAGGPRASTDKRVPKPEPKILFQRFFKSVGPRTYAAQVKEAGNGNQFLVLTEGKRDEKTGEVKKLRLFLFSEDFAEFFGMFDDTRRFIEANPVSPEVARKRQQFWRKQNSPDKAVRRTQPGGKS